MEKTEHIHKWDDYKEGQLSCSLCNLTYTKFLHEDIDSAVKEFGIKSRSKMYKHGFKKGFELGVKSHFYCGRCGVHLTDTFNFCNKCEEEIIKEIKDEYGVDIS